MSQALAKDATIHEGVDLGELARGQKAEGFSGADLSALVREAGLSCLKESMATVDDGKDEKLCIQRRHFEMAFDAVLPSVSKEDQREYDRIRDRISRARSRQATEGDGGKK